MTSVSRPRSRDLATPRCPVSRAVSLHLCVLYCPMTQVNFTLGIPDNQLTADSQLQSGTGLLRRSYLLRRHFEYGGRPPYRILCTHLYFTTIQLKPTLYNRFAPLQSTDDDSDEPPFVEYHSRRSIKRQRQQSEQQHQHQRQQQEQQQQHQPERQVL